MNYDIQPLRLRGCSRNVEDVKRDVVRIREEVYIVSVLTDQELKLILDKEIVIHPHEEDQCFSSKGYDLRVGFALALNKEAHATGASETDTITIPAGTSAFIITKEYVWLSKKLVGTFHARGKLAAQGLFVDSTMVDSLWQGQLLFLVYNAASERDVVLQVGEPFVTMMLHRVVVPTTRPRPSSFMDVVKERGEYYGESFTQKLITYLLDQNEQNCRTAFEALVTKAQSPSLRTHLWSNIIAAFSGFRWKFRPILTGLVWVIVIGLLVVSATLEFYWSWLQSLFHFTDPYGGTVLVTQLLVCATAVGLLAVLLKK